MTTAKAKAGYLSLGVLLTLIFLFPTLNQMRREQKQGLLLSPEEVKGTCGVPQAGDSYKLIYTDGDGRLELQFMDVNHKMYLSHVKWSTNRSAGDINQVTTDAISGYVKGGSLPACLEQAAR